MKKTESEYLKLDWTKSLVGQVKRVIKECNRQDKQVLVKMIKDHFDCLTEAVWQEDSAFRDTLKVLMLIKGFELKDLSSALGVHETMLYDLVRNPVRLKVAQKINLIQKAFEFTKINLNKPEVSG